MPSVSSLFLLFSILENLLPKIFLGLDENLRGIFIRQEGVRDQRAAWGAPRGQGDPLAAAPLGHAGRARPCPLEVALAPLDAHKYLINLILMAR